MNFSSKDFIEAFESANSEKRELYFRYAHLHVRVNREFQIKLVTRMKKCTQCVQYIDESDNIIFSKSRPLVDKRCDRCGELIYEIWRCANIKFPKRIALEAMLDYATKLGYSL